MHEDAYSLFAQDHIISVLVRLIMGLGMFRDAIRYS